MKVRMRPAAGLIASAQMSMSFACAGEPADHQNPRPPGDLVDALEIALARDGQLVDDVDAHLVEQLGDFELLLEGHGGAGALLAVAEGGVDDDAVFPLAATSSVTVGFGPYCKLMFSSSTPWPGSLARPASRLNYRGFLLPSPERQPRFTWREQRCSGVSKEEFSEDDGRSERGGRQSQASSKILLAKSLH